MQTQTVSTRIQRPVLATGTLITGLVFLKIALQLATAGRYGIFRDELYYVACARHMGLGYVDQPPLIAWVTWFAMHVFGTSLVGLRLLPAIAGGLLVWVTAAIAREMGGGRFAQCMAGFAVIPVPDYLMMHHWLTMNAFEPLLWMAMLWLTLRMRSRKEPRYWLAIGALAGVGLLNKYSMLFLIAGLLAGVLATRERRLLRSRWFVAGVVIGFLLFLPNLVWLVQHHFPFLEFERNSRMSGSRIERQPVDFVWDQMVLMNPLLAPLWVGGLGWLLLSRRGKPYRFLGVVFLVVFGVLLLLKAKNYYVAPIYPVLFAAGAVALESVTEARARWTRLTYVAALVFSGLVLAPLSVPVLPVDEFVAYQRELRGFNPIRMERLGPDLLPQHFADEFGWEEMVQRTARVFNGLPEEQRRDTAIFGNNYGEAAAVDFFGPRYGLPESISKYQSFWLWGPRAYSGKTVLILGSDGRGDREIFHTVEDVGPVGNQYVRSEERFDLYLCRDLSTNLKTLWPKIKSW